MERHLINRSRRQHAEYAWPLRSIIEASPFGYLTNAYPHDGKSMMRYRPFALLVVFLLHPSLSSPIHAQSDQVDEYIQIEMKKRLIPGLALVVIRDGEIVKMKGYGFANLEHEVPVNPDTVFELASVTKQFTAAAVMALVDEGNIRVDDPIVQYLPNSPQHWKDITVR